MKPEIAIAGNDVGKKLVELGAEYLGFQRYDISKIK